jgi:hypothetical protein
LKTRARVNKTNHEERVFTFLKNNLGLAKCAHTKSESPDFILHTDSGDVGVEITGLLEPDKKERSSVKSNLTDQVIDLLTEKLPFPFILDIQFDAISKSRQENSIRVKKLSDIFEQIAKDLENHQQIEFFKFDSLVTDFPEHIQNRILQDGHMNLPEGVIRISITREDFLNQSYNSQREGGLVPDLTFDRIQEAINNKDKKVGEYKTMNEQWLVLEEGNGIAGRYTNMPTNETFETLFDRIFIVRIIDNDLIELNLRYPLIPPKNTLNF